MEWLIEDALAPAPLAGTLAPQIEARAPHLVRWLQTADARYQAASPTDTLCTPAQAWQLQRAGFQASAELPLASAWPALHSNASSAQPVWWAQPCHLEVTQQGVTLTPPAILALQPAEHEALLNAVLPDLHEAGIRCSSATTTPWCWQLPAGWNPQAPTPECAAGEAIQHWWPQSPAARPWRRLLNLVQMVWHDHPVNQARAAAGQLPANSLWLFGGASPAQLPARQEADQFRIFQQLTGFAKRNDWNAWLQALQDFDAEALAPGQAKAAVPAQRLILTGPEGWLTLEAQPARGLARWLPRRRANWQARLFQQSPP